MDKPSPGWTTQTWHYFTNFLKPSSLLYIALLSSLATPLFLCYGFSPPLLVSIPVLLLSSIFIYSFSKRLVVTAAVEEEEEEEEADDKPSQGSETIVAVVVPELCVTQKSDNEASELHEYQVESTEFPSDGETSSDDSPRNEIFELKWMKHFNNDACQSLAFCESSASDYDGEEVEEDDDLIEICLPPNESSVYADELSSTRTYSWGKPGFSNEFVIREEDEEGMMEEVEEIDEVNEEDNLMEIDLSIGSIKSSSFHMED
ncbi:unnamed protein product [Linum trigynum]|uniref:Uncharacterized protein n=1 Tax=Linum trigynum TaxID=586398 RepID=A0AAV2EFJ3_9ROSI